MECCWRLTSPNLSFRRAGRSQWLLSAHLAGFCSFMFKMLNYGELKQTDIEISWSNLTVVLYTASENNDIQKRAWIPPAPCTSTGTGIGLMERGTDELNNGGTKDLYLVFFYCFLRKKVAKFLTKIKNTVKWNPSILKGTGNRTPASGTQNPPNENTLKGTRFLTPVFLAHLNHPRPLVPPLNFFEFTFKSSKLFKFEEILPGSRLAGSMLLPGIRLPESSILPASRLPRE